MSNSLGWQRSEAFPEPDAHEVDLVGVLKALADPARLAIVRVLSDGRMHPCTTEEYGLSLHKSTLSHHLRTLREAGVTATRVSGREHAVALRQDDLDERFPGLLAGVLGSGDD